jgi:phospholipid/cholesterol/gamma-HCH transport system substrate-binding protein
MASSPTPPDAAPPGDLPPLIAEPQAPAVPNLALKARLLLLFTAVLIVGATLFLLYARGVFEPTQTLVLTTDDSEGVVVGMDMSFSGFPIGRVRRVELGRTGQVRILIDVARKDAHWLRTGSVFTLVRGVVGGAAIRAYSGVLTDPPLPDGAERPVLRGDATADIPRLVAAARETLENLQAITAGDAALQASLANLQAATERLKGPQGALGALFGNDQDARRIVGTIERANSLLARIDQLTARVDQIAGRADTQVFGPGGVMPEVRASVIQLNSLLGDARTSLRKVDAVLAQAQGIGSDVKGITSEAKGIASDVKGITSDVKGITSEAKGITSDVKGITSEVKGATVDLGPLRAEVEANLRRIDALIGDINRRWPFAREPEIKLP